MKHTNTQLTTVKILTDVYSKFKQVAVESNINLQKIVNRSLDKYISDNSFKEELDNHMDLQISGSQF